MFRGEIRKIMYICVTPQFYCIKVGFEQSCMINDFVLICINVLNHQKRETMMRERPGKTMMGKHCLFYFNYTESSWNL